MPVRQQPGRAGERRKYCNSQAPRFWIHPHHTQSTEATSPHCWRWLEHITTRTLRTQLYLHHCSFSQSTSYNIQAPWQLNCQPGSKCNKATKVRSLNMQTACCSEIISVTPKCPLWLAQQGRLCERHAYNMNTKSTSPAHIMQVPVSVNRLERIANNTDRYEVSSNNHTEAKPHKSLQINN